MLTRYRNCPVGIGLHEEIYLSRIALKNVLNFIYQYALYRLPASPKSFFLFFYSSHFLPSL